jgi:hypothetical protein
MKHASIHRNGILSLVRTARMLAFSLTLGLLFCAPVYISCSASQQGAQTALTGIISVTVDLCDIAQNVTPAPAEGFVTLLCKIAGAVEETAQVLISQDVWADMQAEYLATHGSLPSGMRQMQRRNALQPGGTGLPKATDAGLPTKDAGLPTKDAAPPKSAKKGDSLSQTGIEVHLHKLPME